MHILGIHHMHLSKTCPSKACEDYQKVGSKGATTITKLTDFRIDFGMLKSSIIIYLFHLQR